MTSDRRELLLGAGLAGLTVLVAVTSLVAWDDDTWVQLAVLASAPVFFVAPYLFLDLLRDSGSQRLLERATSPLVSTCFALSFLALAVVTGAGVAGWVGALVGGVVGLVLALQGLAANRRIRSAIGPDDTKHALDGNRVVMLLGTALGLAAMVALLAGFGYLLFGRTGAIVMGIFQGILLLTALSMSVVVGMQRPGKDA